MQRVSGFMFFCLLFVCVVVATTASYLRNGVHSPLQTGDTGSSAPRKRCHTKDLSTEEREFMRLTLYDTSSLIKPGSRDHTKSIAVYFHILTSNSGEGDVDDAVIDRQIKVLNDDFSNSGSKFSFELVEIDRTADNAWFTAAVDSEYEGELKSALHKGSYRDLNIYTTSQYDGLLGWATYPKQVTGDDLLADGVIVDYTTLPGGSSLSYHQGHMLTHEVGHWLGLFHTFEGGCVEDENGGDEVSDTPAVRGPNEGCPRESTDTCPGSTGGLAGNDPIHNYMDYTDDSCMNNFTPGQVERMRRYWNIYRADHNNDSRD